jgi:hypothetical protein
MANEPETSRKEGNSTLGGRSITIKKQPWTSETLFLNLQV